MNLQYNRHFIGPLFRARLFPAILALILGVTVSSSARAVSVDQGFIEKNLAETRNFLRVINDSVSNFGDEKMVKDFQESIKHDFFARIWYLQGAYVKSYKEIRKCHEILKQIYRDMLFLYTEQARAFLEKPAPSIIRSNDAYAQHFLKLGFRDLKSSKDFLHQGENYSRLMFSNKVHIYIKGIKRARRAKRYAILSMIEAKTPRQEKPQFQLQTMDDALGRDKKQKVKISDYKRVRNRLQDLFNRQLLEKDVVTDDKKELPILLHHDDNYAVIAREKTSILDNAKINFKPGSEIPAEDIVTEYDLVKEAKLKEKSEASMDPNEKPGVGQNNNPPATGNP